MTKKKVVRSRPRMIIWSKKKRRFKTGCANALANTNITSRVPRGLHLYHLLSALKWLHFITSVWQPSGDLSHAAIKWEPHRSHAITAIKYADLRNLCGPFLFQGFECWHANFDYARSHERCHREAFGRDGSFHPHRFGSPAQRSSKIGFQFDVTKIRRCSCCCLYCIYSRFGD